MSTRRRKSVAQSDLGTISSPSATLLDALGGGPTHSGARVSQGSALQVSAVFACVRNLAEDVAKLDFGIWRGDGQDEKRKWTAATSHPLHRIFRRPNKRQDLFQVVQQMMWSMLLRGSSYTAILRDMRGQPTSLVPIMPDRVTTLETSDGEIYYRIDGLSAAQKALLGSSQIYISEADMLVLHYASLDGIYGISPISVARESIGLSLTFEEYQARLFANGARPSGVLTHPRTLGKEAAARLKQSWHSAHSGARNAGRTAILEEGMKWENMGMTSVDAEFLASRRFTVEEICRIFRVPPHMVGDLSRSTNNNIEHQGLEYLNQTLMPFLERFERGFKRTFDLPDDLVVEIDTAKLLRADLMTQIKSYSMAVANGIFTQNEVRKIFGYNPLPGGNKLRAPPNQSSEGGGAGGTPGNGEGLPGDSDTGRER